MKEAIVLGAACVATAALTLALGAGCGDPRPLLTGQVHDSAGVHIVQAPPEAPDMPEWKLELVRVAGGTGGPPRMPRAGASRLPSGHTASDGSADDEPWFRRISAVDVGPDGLVYVLDGLEKRVTVIDPADGSVVRRFGRAGRGPAEFRSPSELAFRHDGDLMVGERMPLYLHRIASDGRHRSARLLDARAVTRATPEGRSGPEGGFLAEWGAPDSSGVFVRLLSLSFDPSEAGRYAIVRASLDGRVERELLAWNQPFSLARLPRLFEASRSWTTDRAGRVLVSPGDRYEIRTYDASGRLLTLLRREAIPRPVTEALRRRARSDFVDAMREGGAPPSMLEDVAEGLESASVLPAIRGLWTATPGRELWVGIPMARPDGGGAVDVGAFDVYSMEGDFLARVPSPPGFVLHRVHGGRILGEWTGALDVPRLAIFDVVRE